MLQLRDLQFFQHGRNVHPEPPTQALFKPYHPPTGFFDERPQASTVPSAAGFCSSALPNSIQSPCFLSIECRSLMHLKSYFNCVLPTCTTRAGGFDVSSRYASNSEVPGGVFRCQGFSFVPLFANCRRRNLGLRLFKRYVHAESVISPLRGKRDRI
jgi:hypothetical protein